MTANEKTIMTFETRLRQMILRFQELKKEQQQNDYDSLKMAKMIEITDGNLDGAKERLSKLIRDVNKCIAILSDEK